MSVTMICLLIIIVYTMIAVIGNLWFQRELAKETKGHGLYPVTAIINMVKQNELRDIKIVRIKSGDNFYYPSGNVVAISSDVLERRDLESVSVVTHEIAHAVQRKRSRLLMLACDATIIAFFIPFLSLINFPNFVTVGLPYAMLSLLLVRAGIEADAWVIAHYTLKKWGYSGIKKRLAIAGVLSYL